MNRPPRQSCSNRATCRGAWHRCAAPLFISLSVIVPTVGPRVIRGAEVAAEAAADQEMPAFLALPIPLAGGGCGTITTGRHLRFPSETPLSNLWLSLLDRMDASVDHLGDSTGRLAELIE